ncbi:MAG TPA: response regulator [Gaiellaceae bacterium]|nr:response regulator [Gaiellaceae bacterium]
MANDEAQILVVDDDPVNRMLLERSLASRGHSVTTAENGEQALALLQSDPGGGFDLVLLDIVMPEIDGYTVLARIKEHEALRHLPVIMISAVDELESVVRCIEAGATDYLPKPFDPALLEARINTSLADKRLRDLELEYLEQVRHVIEGAAAVEEGRFEPETLDDVARRPDALGQLARVFQRMAREVRAREERLQQQVAELRIEIDEARQAHKVAEITETEYFKGLREQAAALRRTMGGS